MDLFLSFLTGGASGLLGTVLSGVMSFFQARQRHQQALEMRQTRLRGDAFGGRKRRRSVAALELGSADRTKPTPRR